MSIMLQCQYKLLSSCTFYIKSCLFISVIMHSCTILIFYVILIYIIIFNHSLFISNIFYSFFFFFFLHFCHAKCNAGNFFFYNPLPLLINKNLNFIEIALYLNKVLRYCLIFYIIYIFFFVISYVYFYHMNIFGKYSMLRYNMSII
jgi:hypothetical protein